MDFGATHGIGSQGMVWQYLDGHRALNTKAAAGFARGLSCQVSDFSPRLAKEITMLAASQGPAPDSQAKPREAQDLARALHPKWRTTLRLIAERPPEEQARIAESVNVLLGSENMSDGLRTTLRRNRSNSSDIKKKRSDP